MSQLGPYSRPVSLNTIDGRSREARLLRRVRTELSQHVGGKPSATQRMLIERAASLALHVEMLDRKVQAGGVMTELDSRTYLAWSNSLTRTLRELGLNGAPERAADLHSYLAETDAA